MRANEIITEALTSPYPYTIKPFKLDAVEAEFKSAATTYRYTMFLIPLMLDRTVYHIDDVAILGSIVFSDAEGEIHMTGKGDAFRVMATVIAITKNIVSNKKIAIQFIKREIQNQIDDIDDEEKIIEVINFSAPEGEQSKAKLYSRFAKNMPGYSIIMAEEGDYTLIANSVDQDRVKEIERTLEQ